MTSTDDNFNRLQDLVALSIRQGADAADAICGRSSSLSHTQRNGAIENHERADSQAIGLRVIVDGREATISSDDIDPKNFPKIVDQALAMARVLEHDPYVGLAKPDQLYQGALADLDLYDHNIPDVAQLTQWAKAAEEAGRSVKGVINSEGGSANWSLSEIWICGSNGLQGHFSGTNSSISAAMVAGDDTGMEVDFDYTQAAHVEDLDDAAAVGKSAGEYAVSALGARRVETGKYPVLFDPRVSNSLIGHLASAMNGSAVVRKSSFLIDQVGKAICAKPINIVDDPHRLRGFASKPYDAEGLANKKTHLIKDGVMQNWILDLTTARQLGMQSTGHASRAGASRPRPSTTNLTLEAGATSRADMIASIKSGFLVTSLMGQGVNMVTGDYSRGAKGFWIENGEIAYPVSELTIAGRLQDIFANMIACDDLCYRQSTNAPSVMVEGMTVAGS